MIVPRSIAAFLRIFDKRTNRVGQQKILFGNCVDSRIILNNSVDDATIFLIVGIILLALPAHTLLVASVALRLACAFSSVYI